MIYCVLILDKRNLLTTTDLIEETFKILRAYEQYLINNYNFEFKALASKPNTVVVKI